MLEPISDGLLIILSFWDKPNASVGKDTGHRHVSSEMSPQGALAILSFILIISSSLRCHSSTGIVVVQSLSHLQLFATPWTAALQASLSFTISLSLLKLTSIESVMSFNHLILSHPLLLPSIFPSIRVFSSESALCIRWPKYWSSSFSTSSSSEYSGLTYHSSKASVFSALSLLYDPTLTSIHDC